MNSGNFTKHPTLRKLIMQHSKINLDIKARLDVNDETLEYIIDKMYSFSSTINNLFEYNKNIETKIT
jgi:hypothetical protein